MTSFADPAPRGLRSDRRAHAVRVGLGLVPLAAVVIAALVALMLNTARGQALEERVMGAMYTNPRIDQMFNHGLDLVSEGAVALAILGVLVIGMLRRRIDLGAGAALLIVGANVTTQLLKYRFVDRADYGWSGDNTLPSGHVTVITSILMALVLVLPARWRPTLVPCVAFLATCAGIGTIVLNWHRPSDVIAAYAVILGWTGLVVAGLAAAGRLRGRVPGGVARAVRYAAGAAFAVCVVGVLILGAGVAPVSSRRDMLVAALAFVTVALLCAGTIALATYVIDLLGDGELRAAPALDATRTEPYPPRGLPTYDVDRAGRPWPAPGDTSRRPGDVAGDAPDRSGPGPAAPGDAWWAEEPREPWPDGGAPGPGAARY